MPPTSRTTPSCACSRATRPSWRASRARCWPRWHAAWWPISTGAARSRWPTSKPWRRSRKPEARALALDALVEIDRRLDALAPAVRRAFLLSQLDGLGQAEIAAQLGVSLATVQRYLVKALHQCCFAP